MLEGIPSICPNDNVLIVENSLKKDDNHVGGGKEAR